jgi:hypothetical protein
LLNRLEPVTENGGVLLYPIFHHLSSVSHFSEVAVDPPD